MPRPTLGERALTLAERQTRHRERKAGQVERMRAALERIQAARTIREARAIAAAALSSETTYQR